ncbi:hypothetical protein GW17_00060364 [Ensete ventricosum]|nr:hypothetical protein GW17_00060364 [Ensete ventricosum]
MATVSASEVEREGCQTSDVDINYREGPESSDPRMKTALAMLCFYFILSGNRDRGFAEEESTDNCGFAKGQSTGISFKGSSITKIKSPPLKDPL